MKLRFARLERHQVMQWANAFHYRYHRVSRGEALAIAWRCLKLKKALRAGVVDFVYQKKDGTIRTAKGTTNALLLPKNLSPYAGSEGPQNDKVIKYFDYGCQAWRSLLHCNLLSVG